MQLYFLPIDYAIDFLSKRRRSAILSNCFLLLFVFLKACIHTNIQSAYGQYYSMYKMQLFHTTYLFLSVIYSKITFYTTMYFFTICYDDVQVQ